MKIHNSLNINNHSFLGQTTNRPTSPFKNTLLGLENITVNLSAKDSTELSPEFKKRLQLLDQIKNNKENFWENLDIHYGYMIGFTSHMKERLEYFIENVDTLMNDDAHESNKVVARSSLESVKYISQFSLDRHYAESNYLTDGKLQEFTERYIHENYGDNASFDDYSPFHSPLQEFSDLKFDESTNLDDLKQSLEKAVTKIDNCIEAMKEIRNDLKEFYRGQSTDDKLDDKNAPANKNTMKFTLLNLLLIYTEMSRDIPKDSPIKQIIKEEQEALHNDILKTDILNLPEYSLLLDYKI
jgi:hypothetical protein